MSRCYESLGTPEWCGGRRLATRANSVKSEPSTRVALALGALAWAGFMLYLGTIDPQDIVGLSGDMSERVLHVVAGAVLGVLAMMAVGKRPFVVFAVIVLAGLAGETAQLATADRMFSWIDLSAHTIGAAVGVGLGVLAAGRNGAAIAALVVASTMAVATPFLLEEVTPQWMQTERKCFAAPAPWPEQPDVVLAADLRGAQLPMSIAEPSTADLVQAVDRTDEFTLEVWFETPDLEQDGPAQVFTISDGLSQNRMNLHLGVRDDDLVVRLRTACERFRWLRIPNVLEADVPVHVVVTWSAGELVTFVDAEEVSRVVLPWGELDAWDPSFTIRVGAEVDDGVGDDKVFVGEVFSVTMWDAALSSEDIALRRRLGP